MASARGNDGLTAARIDALVVRVRGDVAGAV